MPFSREFVHIHTHIYAHYLLFVIIQELEHSSEEIQRLRVAAEEQRILNADLISQVQSHQAKLKIKDDYIKSLDANGVVSGGEDESEDSPSDDKDESEGSSSDKDESEDEGRKDDNDLDYSSGNADFGVGGFDESLDYDKEADDSSSSRPDSSPPVKAPRKTKRLVRASSKEDNTCGSITEKSLADSDGNTNTQQSIANSLEALVTKERQTYNLISKRLDTNSGSLVAGRTHMLLLIQYKVVAFFQSSTPKLSDIRSITQDFMAVIATLSKYQRYGAFRLGMELEDMEAGIRIGDSSNTFGTILSILGEDEEKVGEDLEPSTSDLKGLRQAIYRLEHGDDSDGEVSETAMMTFIQVGRVTKRLLKHVLHIYIMVYVMSDVNLGEMFSYLRKKKEFTDRAKELCRLVGSDFDIAAREEGSGSVWQYVVAVIRPALSEKHGHLATQLATQSACDIKSSLTNTRGKELGSLLRGAYNKVQSTTASGLEASGQDYCGGEDKGDQRRRMSTSFFSAFLYGKIQERLPPGLFAKRGYLRTLLNASPTEIDNGCNGFFTHNFYEGDRHGENSKIVKGLKAILREKPSDVDFDSGSRTIIVESQETIKCLMRLTEGL